MASQDHSSNKPPANGGASKEAMRSPDWAGGLKQLYNSVVEEPLPDAFKDLLDRLDDGAMPLPDGDKSTGGASGNAA